MESNKTEVLSFDDALNNHKKVLTESLVNFDEGHRVRKILLDVDSNSADYEYYFHAGQQSKQSEVDDLHKRVKELELINFDSELHFDAAKEHIDSLQKRIDDALKNISFEQWSDEYGDFQAPTYNLIKILKGEETK